MVEITLSFAKRPVKIATVAGQLWSSMPIGRKTGVVALPTEDRSEFSLFSFPNEPSRPIWFRNPSRSTIGRITFEARKRKIFRRSQVCATTLIICGTW